MAQIQIDDTKDYKIKGANITSILKYCQSLQWSVGNPIIQDLIGIVRSQDEETETSEKMAEENTETEKEVE